MAAKASGVEQQTLDMALQRFTRRAAEAAQEAKDALAQMGIALRDQSGNLRRSAAGRGLWRHPALAPRLPSQIGGTVSRFHMVQGDVLRGGADRALRLPQFAPIGAATLRSGCGARN